MVIDCLCPSSFSELAMLSQGTLCRICVLVVIHCNGYCPWQNSVESPPASRVIKLGSATLSQLALLGEKAIRFFHGDSRQLGQKREYYVLKYSKRNALR